jgi:ribonuclease P protein component
MLQKKRRLSKKDIDLIFKEGKSISSSSLNFKFTLTPSLVLSRISFIAPKNIAKLAVKRNLLRRRGYRALGKHIDQFPLGIIGVFVFKKFQEDISIIENEIKNILSKIN